MNNRSRLAALALGLAMFVPRGSWGQGTCTAPAAEPPAPQPATPGWPGWLLRERRYPELAHWVSDHPAAFMSGVLANRQNQNAVSIKLLEPLLPRLGPNADSVYRRVLLRTLADDYTKTYRYGAAADALRRLERQDAAAMTAADLDDLRADIQVRDLLRTAPPQHAIVPRPFAVPMRRDSIGLLETPIRAGSDSSWWIVDTGANLSTITESTAHRLGLRLSRDTGRTKGITGDYSSLHVAIIPELRLGPARIQNVAVLVLADSALDIPQVPFQITAILGYPVLEALDRIAIAPDSLQVRPHPAGTPTQNSNLYLEELSPLVAVSVDGVVRLYHFDSGADQSSLSVAFCLAYPKRMAAAAPHTIEIGGAGGAKRFSGYQLTRLPMTIGGTTTVLDSVFVFRQETGSAFDPLLGNLGQDIVGPSGGFTIDFRAMTLQLGVDPEGALGARRSPTLRTPSTTATPIPVHSTGAAVPSDHSPQK
jgi:predicted aspartyl protease